MGARPNFRASRVLILLRERDKDCVIAGPRSPFYWHAIPTVVAVYFLRVRTAFRYHHILCGHFHFCTCAMFQDEFQEVQQPYNVIVKTN